MSEPPQQGMERRCDVAVVGGSAAGLAAALQLVRQRRSVIVVDDGTPRDLAAAVAHGYRGHDGEGPVGLVAAGRAEVRRYGGEVVTGRVLQVARAEDGELRVELTGGHAVVARRVLAATGVADEGDGGRRLAADVVAVGTRWRARVAPFVALGLEPVPHPSGLGDVVEVDATGATSVQGLFAAGDLTYPSRQLLPAAADGGRVGAMIAFDLAGEDLRTGPRPPATEAEWDHRYSGAPLWSGSPNGALVAELSGASPGRALDVGAGEGGDALWLARQGWKVTASDVSRRGLDRVATAARQQALDVECLHADANAREPFAAGAFDLVCAHYASIPRTPDRRAVRNLLDAAAPGGTVLVVGHDLGPMREPLEVAVASRPFDPDAYVRVDDVAEVLAGEDDWEVQVHETRPRPPGATSAGHHVHDVVLRARRRR